jgi:mannan endo-1,4-beta-mannosidase
MHSRSYKNLLLLTVAVLANLITSVGMADGRQANFITRRGDQLFDGDRPYRFISMNIPNLIVQEDAYEFTKPNPWRWPDEFEIEDALESVRQMGGQVVRTYVLSVHRDGSDMGHVVDVERPGEFNEEGFRTLDKVIEIARRKKIRVIIPFVDQAKWWGGIGEYAAFRGKPADAFWSDPQIIEDFEATVKHLIERKNSFTGVAYRDEPAVFGWETGNEIFPTPEWTRQVAAYIKQLDKNHLVLDGKSLKGVPVESLDDPNVDVITTHHYPWGEDHDFRKPIREAQALTKGKKAFFVGEFGFVETPHIASAIQEVIDDGSSGALLWSLRMHRREGGFYWHMEVGTGKNIYKAFHWPGFESGKRYDEKAVMSLVREKAFEIRGEQAPAIERPKAPKLLPIEKVSAISWQGSAGASGYDVLRARAAAGPWEKIATNVSDADVQYRPLFHDDRVKPGERYWYRVVARDAAGESEPSNIVGPVTANCGTLVDECDDLSLTAATAGKVTETSENARTVQEDCHRLAIEPGASVVYRVDGAMGAWRVFSFAPARVLLSCEVSRDGKEFHPVVVKSRAYSSGETVYGYSTPILVSGTAGGQDAKYLRISAPEKAQGSAQPEAPVQLSRVEIEYDNGVPKPGVGEGNAAKSTQLNSSVFVYTGLPIEPTLAAIDEAAKHGERQLNVVVTVLADFTENLHLNSYGSYSGENYEYEPYDEAMHQVLREKLHAVFERMVEHHMAIYVLPHIDAGGKVKQWRNWVDFDPLESYEGYSYGDLVLGTIADELAETVTPTTRVELALSGEMGTSMFQHADSYLQIVAKLRARPKLKHMKIGISCNHDKIAGEGNPKGRNEIRFTDEQRNAMQRLIDETDFVGMSAYIQAGNPPTIDDFVRGIERFIKQFSALGLNVPTTKPLQFTEMGIGGRQLRPGKADVEQSLQAPWEGTAVVRQNPWVDDSLREMRQQYHEALIKFLTTQPADWRVTAAFFWSMGSWDPWGHGNLEFGDPVIQKGIEEHNRAVGN